MEYSWKHPLLITLIILLTALETHGLPTEKHHQKGCKNSKHSNCLKDEEKIIQKRQTIISLEKAASCNITRQMCIDNCRENWECIKECPICPEVYPIQENTRRIIVEGKDDSYIHESPITGTNVTTVIKLVNMVNNTNLIDIPTNVNLTNQNHVHVYQNDSSEEGGEFGLGYNRFGSCCIVVEPKTCTATSRGSNCHHKRRRSCGQQCISRIIHAESRQRCTSSENCSRRVSYIPQPKKPRCVYTSKWPFVSCGGNYQQNCDGCYEHYGYGANLYYGEKIPAKCHGCYDDAFNMGPLYRRGPVLRPFNYHQPPCYLTGTCHIPFCGIYGCFGNEFMDPSWGSMGYMGGSMPMGYGRSQFGGMLPPHHPMLSKQFINSDDSNEETSNNFIDIEDNLKHIPNDGADWGVETHKCRVVENNGTVNIKNCTETEFERNPFAASPSSFSDESNESQESAGNHDFINELDEYMRLNPSSTYEGFDTVAINNEISDRKKKLHRRHAKNHRKLHLTYDD